MLVSEQEGGLGARHTEPGLNPNLAPYELADPEKVT